MQIMAIFDKEPVTEFITIIMCEPYPETFANLIFHLGWRAVHRPSPKPKGPLGGS